MVEKKYRGPNSSLYLPGSIIGFLFMIGLLVYTYSSSADLRRWSLVFIFIGPLALLALIHIKHCKVRLTEDGLVINSLFKRQVKQNIRYIKNMTMEGELDTTDIMTTFYSNIKSVVSSSNNANKLNANFEDESKHVKIILKESLKGKGVKIGFGDVNLNEINILVEDKNEFVNELRERLK